MAGGGALKVLDRPAPGALAEITQAEIDVQVRTARAYPRDVHACQAELKSLVTASEDIAADCIYTLERKEAGGGKKFIVGPSIRFAELLVYCFGNIRWGARIIDEGREFVIAQGFAADLQRNTGVTGEVRRRITTRDGSRFSTDMIAVTSGAACSIAMRNAIFDTIPEAVWWDIYEAARVRAVGDQKTLKQRIDRAIEFFVKAGADEAMIYPALGVEKRSEFTLDHLAIMTGLRNALKENAISIDRLFHPDAHAEREKLSLMAEEDSFGSIDKQIAGKTGGADAKASAAQGSASGGDKAKGKAAKEKADSPAKAAAPPKTTGGSDRPAESHTSGTEATDGEAKSKPAANKAETDADLVARVEREHAATRTGKQKIIKAAKAELERIAVNGSDELVARANKLLNLYDLEEPQE